MSESTTTEAEPLVVRKKEEPITAMQFTVTNGYAVIDWLKSGHGWAGHSSDKDRNILSIGVAVVEDLSRRTRTAYIGYWIVRDPWDHFTVLFEDEFEATYEPA